MIKMNIGRMKSYRVAMDILFRSLGNRSPDREQVRLNKALDRVLATSIFAPSDLPARTQAEVEGYALRSADTFTLYQEGKGLKLVKPDTAVLGKGEAAPVSVGSYLPEGGDTVIGMEDVPRIEKGFLSLSGVISAGRMVIPAGRELRKGNEALTAGHRLGSADLSLLARLGISRVEVFRRPVVGILVAGGKLVPLSRSLKPGQEYDGNTVLLAALSEESGGKPRPLGLVRGEVKAVVQAFEKAIPDCDVIVTTGSLLPSREEAVELIGSLGKPGVLVAGVALPGGRSIILAEVQERPLICLPGYPPKVQLSFDLFVRPVLDFILHRREEEKGARSDVNSRPLVQRTR